MRSKHPIYTGMLGMLLGSLLLAGVGRSLLILLTGIVFFEVKICAEERLMSAAALSMLRLHSLSRWHLQFASTTKECDRDDDRRRA